MAFAMLILTAVLVVLTLPIAVVNVVAPGRGF
jgi:hypothetical protein